MNGLIITVMVVLTVPLAVLGFLYLVRYESVRFRAGAWKLNFELELEHLEPRKPAPPIAFAPAELPKQLMPETAKPMPHRRASL